MDLVRPGAVGFGLCLAGALLAVVIAFPLASAMGFENGVLLAVTSIPVLAGAGAGGALAGRVHQEPERNDARRHLLAALCGVVVFAVLQAATVRPGVDGEWIARALNLVLPPAAALLGLRLFDRAR